MIAIPVLRSRVAPVLDWCSRMQIFPADPFYAGAGEEIVLPELPGHQKLQVLREKGVTCLICGALSAELHLCARHLGIHIVCGVAGEIAEVLESFWRQQLDQPRFWLPGCGGQCRYRNRGQGKSVTCQGRGRGKGRV